MNEPGTAPESVWVINVKASFWVIARLGLVQVMVPVLPALGVEQFHPDGLARETKVIPAGSVSVMVALSALSGPLLATMIW